MKERICEECNETFESDNQRNRHVKVHGHSLESYVLKFKHNDIKPTCACTCGGIPAWNIASKDYAKFVHGHHAYGRKKSDDEKRRIGEKNAINMTRFFKENHDIAIERGKQLFDSRTPEVEVHRIQSTRNAYANMTIEDKQKFSDHTKQLWARAGGLMQEAHVRACQTYHERSQNGEYDFTERNDKLSQVISQKYVDGDWKFTKGFYTSVKTKIDHYYRSSWELQYMQILDNDENVVMWESEFTSIIYEFGGAIHRYVPDFHVIRLNDKHQLIEIKPQALRITERNTLKREAAKKFCESKNWEYVEWEPIDPKKVE